ncbi:alpha/beta hydrolase family protein [Shewanella zhangzhouensis]|uniref:alpha/beta hydrolase family protein n=1 Tax=Shewanella zhangzhouensis TaxID=2864213 RepID=UPI001C65F1D7|nr:S9 family peptidase [Shewanella zhangzhouensis]QYK03706.1 S9 family peptidase [Shewanella zhangzhouensis]
MTSKRKFTKSISSLALISAAFGCLAEQSNPAISVEGFAKHAMFSAIKTSPKGDYLAATYPYEDHKRLAIIDTKTKKITCQFFFRSDESVASFWWANDERVVMSISKQLGQYSQPFGTGELFAGNADCSKREQLFGARNNDMGAAQVEDLLLTDRDNILISSALEKRSYSNLYKLNIYTGKKVLVERATHENASIVLDNNKQWRVSQSYKTERQGLLKSEASGEMVTYYRQTPDSEWKEISIVDMSRESAQGTTAIVGFNATSDKMYLLSNVEQSQKGLYEYDLATGTQKLVYKNDVVDAQPFFNRYFDANGNQISEVVGALVHEGKPKVVFFDEDSAFAKEFRALEASFPQDAVFITSSTADNNTWILTTASDVNPGEFYSYDRVNKKIAYVASSKPWIDKAKMSHKEPVSFKARDGLTIHGYLTVPRGKDAKELPLIVHPHGGPHGPRDYWFYDDEVQVYASAGYAVLQVDFRGSGGYGREFEDSGFGQWGKEMQDDLTDATLWAIDKGIANKDKICISGASYGGYASLMAVVKEPDLYKCAIGYVGVYDLPLMFEKGNVAERLGWGKRYMEQAFGGSEEEMKKASPAYNADKIKAGVFLVHGGRDEQAHYDNAIVMRKALQKVGKEPKWLWKETEAHGFYDEDNREELFNDMLSFLKQYLN